MEFKLKSIVPNHVEGKKQTIHGQICISITQEQMVQSIDFSINRCIDLSQ